MTSFQSEGSNGDESTKLKHKCQSTRVSVHAVADETADDIEGHGFDDIVPRMVTHRPERSATAASLADREAAFGDNKQVSISQQAAQSMTAAEMCLLRFKTLRNKGSVTEAVLGDVAERYTTKELLGKGAFGTVYLVQKNSGGNECYAMKNIIVSGAEKSAGSKDLFEKELAISRRLNHPHICKLHEYSITDGYYHLVMDLCTGGDLLAYLNGPPPKFRGLKTDLAAKLLGQMLSGMAYLHHYRLAHRDIKPENYMLIKKVEIGNLEPDVMLIDFGLARICPKGSFMFTRCGTPQYSAPEIHRGVPYDINCDLWGIGACCITMILADIPFPSADDEELLKAIEGGKLELCYSNKKFKATPKEFQDIVKTLMQVTPADRGKAKTFMLENEWLKKHGGLEAKIVECCSLM